jgi:hypothetical protein
MAKRTTHNGQVVGSNPTEGTPLNLKKERMLLDSGFVRVLWICLIDLGLFKGLNDVKKIFLLNFTNYYPLLKKNS